MNRLVTFFVLATALASLLPPWVYGQLPSGANVLPPADIEEFDSTAATHLENARRFLAEKQWDDAVDSIRRVMENDRGKFAKVEPQVAWHAGFARYLPLREVCQHRLLALHASAPEALAAYRRLVDPLAANWYREAQGANDERLLKRIVEQAVASSWGDDAMLKLGELALARGEYAAARGYWQRIVGQSNTLSYNAGNFPDSELSPAEIHFRLALVSIMEGSRDRAEAELEQLRRQHPTATGQLGGRQGKYVDLFAAQMDQSKTWAAPRLPADWPTFAGSPARDGKAAAGVDMAGRPLWSFPLPRLNAEHDLIGEGKLRVADDSRGLLSYFPIVVGSNVLLRADAREKSYVTALDLESGRSLWQVDYPRVSRTANEPAAAEPEDESQPWKVSDAHAGNVRHLGVARYTLTADEGKVFARMGSPATAPQARRLEQTLAKDQGWLLGLDLHLEGKPLEGFPLQTESAEWSFEGAPVADAGSIYVAMRRLEGSRSQLHVACYEQQTTPGAAPADPAARSTGRLRWRTKIASAATLGGGDVAELSHNLLTLRADKVYCNTNLGVVTALSAGDGQVEWLLKYPRGTFRGGDPDRPESHFYRDLTPCLIAGDLIIVAPADCSQVFAVEAMSGRLVWTLPEGVAQDIVHLLGVGEGHLLASGDFLYWIDVRTGRLVTQYPRGHSVGPATAAPNPRGFGRGVLAGSHIYWPTREAIYVFHQQPRGDGFGAQPQGIREVSLIERGVTGGNLVIAGKKILIATADRLYVFGEASPH